MSQARFPLPPHVGLPPDSITPYGFGPAAEGAPGFPLREPEPWPGAPPVEDEHEARQEALEALREHAVMALIDSQMYSQRLLKDIGEMIHATERDAELLAPELIAERAEQLQELREGLIQAHQFRSSGACCQSCADGKKCESEA